MTYQTSRGPRKQSDNHPWARIAARNARMTASQEELDELPDDEEDVEVVDDGALEVDPITKLRVESDYDDRYADMVELAEGHQRNALTKTTPRRGMRYSTKKSKPLVLDKPLKPPKRKVENDD